MFKFRMFGAQKLGIQLNRQNKAVSSYLLLYFFKKSIFSVFGHK